MNQAMTSLMESHNQNNTAVTMEYAQDVFESAIAESVMNAARSQTVNHTYAPVPPAVTETAEQTARNSVPGAQISAVQNQTASYASLSSETSQTAQTAVTEAVSNAGDVYSRNEIAMAVENAGNV